jgi:sarcosine oxidase subunit delta
MRIPCPCCGERGNEEFTVLGAAQPARPSPDAPLDAWSDHVHLRDNPAGPLHELWHHLHGCRAWLIVERDTRSHEILSVRLARMEASE